MGVTIISPTPGVQPGNPGGFPLSESAARDTPIVVEITSTSAERVELASPGEPDMAKRLIYRNGALQGTWVTRSTKTIIGGGVRLSILPEKGWSANVLRQLALAIDTVATGGNIPPTADFTFVLGANRTVQFTDTSSDPDGTIAAWSWTFGDAGTSSVQNPSHAYAAGGSYSVGLTVTDNLGAPSTTTTKTVYVWHKDQSSSKGCPSSAADWSAFCTSTSQPAMNLLAMYLLQEAAGAPQDSSGAARHLTVFGAAPAYQQVVAGWDRKSIKSTEGVSAKLANSTFPDAASNDFTVLLYAKLAAPSPSNPRSVMHYGQGFDDSLEVEIIPAVGTPFQFGAGFGAGRQVGTSDPTGVVRPLLMTNDAATACALYTDQEKNELGGSAPNGGEFQIGGDFTDSWYCATQDNLWCIVVDRFLTAAESKKLLQDLGWTIPWT